MLAQALPLLCSNCTQQLHHSLHLYTIHSEDLDWFLTQPPGIQDKLQTKWFITECCCNTCLSMSLVNMKRTRVVVLLCKWQTGCDTHCTCKMQAQVSAPCKAILKHTSMLFYISETNNTAQELVLVQALANQHMWCCSYKCHRKAVEMPWKNVIKMQAAISSAVTMWCVASNSFLTKEKG